MSNLVPWWGLVLAGTFVGCVLTCLVFVPLSIWAGLPRKRERALESELAELMEMRDAETKARTKEASAEEGVQAEVEQDEVPEVRQDHLEGTRGSEQG